MKMHDRCITRDIFYSNKGKYYMFPAQKLPIDIQRNIYSYIRDEVLLHTWMEKYDMAETIEGICDENYNSAGTEVISSTYSIYDKNSAKYLLWRHTIPVKEKRMGYWYDDNARLFLTFYNQEHHRKK